MTKSGFDGTEPKHREAHVDHEVNIVDAMCNGEGWYRRAEGEEEGEGERGRGRGGGGGGGREELEVGQLLMLVGCLAMPINRTAIRHMELS